LGHGFRMSVGAHPGGVGEVNAAFASFAEARALPAEVRRSLNVAIDDLLANVLSYGGTGRDPCSVTVEVELDHERVTVTITDNGPPFDPFERSAPDTTLSVEERPIGGLGIHLIKQLVGNMTYKRDGDKNILEIRAKRKRDAKA